MRQNFMSIYMLRLERHIEHFSIVIDKGVSSMHIAIILSPALLSLFNNKYPNILFQPYCFSVCYMF